MSDEAEPAKKLKMTEPSVEKSCAHWVIRKKRFCKMTVAKGREYCGEHLPAMSNELSNDPKEVNRVPCPLDPKHTIYKKHLNKHMKICNARPKENVPDYISKAINAGDSLPIAFEDFSGIKLNELDDEEFYNAVGKVKELYAKHIKGTIDTLQTHHKSLENELSNELYGKESRKHLVQTAALLGILEKQQQLTDDTSYIEFGAGKGQLAFYLARLLQQQENSQVVLLDRMSLRHKKDNKIEDKSLVHRIRVDIADFQMSGLDELKRTKRNVAVSKHLCGAATDLTLRCITQTPEAAASTEFVMIALCCHHRCDWQSYVGKKFLEANSITPRQFVIITKMVGWAICGTGMSRERRKAQEEQQELEKSTQIQQPETSDMPKQRLSLAERKDIGFMCKRVLDYGRLEYLREHNYIVELKYYVQRDITLENVCLLASKSK